MKNLYFLFIITLITFSCKKNSVPQSTSKNDLLGKIAEKKLEKIIKDNPMYFFDGREVNEEYVNVLNKVDLKEFTEIEFIEGKKAVREYGSKAENGVVRIIPFIDTLLGSKYYENVSQPKVSEKLAELKVADSYPLIVLSGRPLRGEEIAREINALKDENIKSWEILKQETAYSIYGIRAKNGVLLIDRQ
jgi:hypothetical protein